MKLPCLLRANPFPVEAWFDFSCTLTFALPVEDVAARLPSGLVPDTHNEHTAFLAVAVVQTRRLRPAGLPAFLGHDFVLVGYRFFVRFTNPFGRTLRGLYILRSENGQVTHGPAWKFLHSLPVRANGRARQRGGKPLHCSRSANRAAYFRRSRR